MTNGTAGNSLHRRRCRLPWAARSAPAGVATGEAVFNTSMTGYQEILTDPSYAGQVVVMTASHIGNYGLTGLDEQSSKPAVSGFVMRSMSRATPTGGRRARSPNTSIVTAWSRSPTSTPGV